MSVLSRELRKVVADAPLLLLIAVFIVAGALAAASLGLEDRFSIFIYPGTAVLLALLMVSLWLLTYSLYTMLILRPHYPIRHIVRRASAMIASVGLLRILVLMGLFTLFLSAVSSLKSLIPAFDAFHWDPLLAHLDAALYGGMEPWRRLQPLLGRPEITQAINVAYNVWFFVMIGLLLWQLFDVRHRERREQFLVAFVLCWIINGVILATLLSSVGPCFYGRLMPGQPDPYGPLMAYLHQANLHHTIWAVSTQDYLWNLYHSGATGVGAGISAMPSMHISMAWMIFLFARRVSYLAGWVMLVFALVIMVGSVELGWHYSIDGYVAVATTSLIWMVAGYWSRWWCGETRPANGACIDKPLQARAVETR